MYDEAEAPESNEAFAEKVKRRVLDRLDPDLLEKFNPNAEVFEDADLVRSSVE